MSPVYIERYSSKSGINYRLSCEQDTYIIESESGDGVWSASGIYPRSIIRASAYNVAEIMARLADVWEKGSLYKTFWCIPQPVRKKARTASSAGQQASAPQPAASELFRQPARARRQQLAISFK